MVAAVDIEEGRRVLAVLKGLDEGLNEECFAASTSAYDEQVIWNAGLHISQNSVGNWPDFIPHERLWGNVVEVKDREVLDLF